MKIALFSLIISLFFIWVFFIEPNLLFIKKYKINDKFLKDFKIVFVGDLHIRPNMQNRLKQIVKLINEQNPDFVLSTGDFVAGYDKQDTMPIIDIVKELKTIQTKYGFYTVLGNHDECIDGKEITKELETNGIKVLANSNIRIKINEKNIYVAGVEDLKTKNPDVCKALLQTSNPTILLTHSPDIFKNVPKDVNLTLAGHVHGGQIRIPFLGALIIPSSFGNKYSQGLIEENGKKMIVTKGIGTSILPIRFNCVPEIIVIEFFE